MYIEYSFKPKGHVDVHVLIYVEADVRGGYSEASQKNWAERYGSFLMKFLCGLLFPGSEGLYVGLRSFCIE